MAVPDDRVQVVIQASSGFTTIQQGTGSVLRWRYLMTEVHVLIQEALEEAASIWQ
jgi:hypothetical protein